MMLGPIFEISRTIAGGLPPKLECTRKIIDFDRNDPFSKKIGACGALWGRLRRALGALGAVR